MTGSSPSRFNSPASILRSPMRRSIGTSSLVSRSGALFQTRTSRTQWPEPRFHFGPRPSISPFVTRIAPANAPGCRLTHRLRAKHECRERDDDDEFDAEKDEKRDQHVTNPVTAMQPRRRGASTIRTSASISHAR